MAEHKTPQAGGRLGRSSDRRRKAQPFDMKRSHTNLEHVHTGIVISEKPDNAGGPLSGSTYTWKPVCAGGLIVCIWEARQSGRPGDKYKVRYMEADHEDEKNAYKNTCLTLFDRYPWSPFFWGVDPSALTGKVSEGLPKGPAERTSIYVHPVQ